MKGWEMHVGCVGLAPCSPLLPAVIFTHSPGPPVPAAVSRLCG